MVGKLKQPFNISGGEEGGKLIVQMQYFHSLRFEDFCEIKIYHDFIQRRLYWKDLHLPIIVQLLISK